MTRSMVMESRALDAFYDPVFTGPSQARSGAPLSKGELAMAVTGQQRYKFFKRPVVPTLDAMPAEVILAPTLDADPLLPPPNVEEPACKDREVQTDYRESEAQTDPYTPAFRVREGDPEPELLLLSKLTHERGLGQVTLLEVQLIEFQRRKHRIESRLPPATDEASLRLRQRILEGLELQAFRIREREIDRNREARLDVLQRLLHERDQAIEYADEQRVEVTRQENLAKRDMAIERIQTLRLQVCEHIHDRQPSFVLQCAGGLSAHWLRIVTLPGPVRCCAS
jgi:hypothetical protein